MKYYSYVNLDGAPLFEVVWGETLKEDKTLAVFRRGAKWDILDIASGLSLCSRVFKSKKACIEWYKEERKTNSLYMRLKTERLSHRYKEKVALMQEHRILKAGDRCTFIYVKDSVILTIIEHLPRNDTWIVEDEWYQFEVSPDKLIKVSEV